MSLSWSDRLAAVLFWTLLILSAAFLNGCAVVKAVSAAYDTDTRSGSISVEIKPTTEPTK